MRKETKETRPTKRFEFIHYAPITRRLKNGGIMIYNWQHYNKAKCNPLPRLYAERDAATVSEKKKEKRREKGGKKRSRRREGTKEEWPKFGATLYRLRLWNFMQRPTFSSLYLSPPSSLFPSHSLTALHAPLKQDTRVTSRCVPRREIMNAEAFLRA